MQGALMESEKSFVSNGLHFVLIKDFMAESGPEGSDSAVRF